MEITNCPELASLQRLKSVIDFSDVARHGGNMLLPLRDSRSNNVVNSPPHRTAAEQMGHLMNASSRR